MRTLSRVMSQTLVILGMADRSVPASVMSFLSRRMASAELRLITYDNSSHQLLTGPDARAINEDVSAWLSSVE